MLYWLIILAIYLPFQLALNPGAGVDLASIRVFILLLFFIWLAEGLRRKQIIISRKSQTGMIVAFLFLNFLSLAWSQNTEWALRKLVFFLSIFPIYFIVSSTADSYTKILKITKTLVISGTILAIMGILQFFAQFIFGLETVYGFWAKYIIGQFLGKSFSLAVLTNPSWLVNISGRTYLRATSVFPDPHMLSFYLGLIFPVAAAIGIKRKSGFWFSASAVLLIGDFLTFSRGGYLGIFAGTIFLIVYFWREIKRLFKFKSTALAILSLAAVVLLVPSPFNARFYSIFNLKEGSNKGRTEIWQQAVNVIIDHPLTGVGLGNYPLEIKPSADYREPIYAHSAYLDIAAETGVINMLVWLGIVLAAAAGFYKKSRKDIFYLGFLTGLIIFAVHSLAETPIYSPTVLTLFLIVIAFSGFKEKENEET
jgi:O-antigen ligase